MTDTYYLAAKQSKLYLWCGQSPVAKPERFYLYTSEPSGCSDRCQDQIAAFLMLHRSQEIAIVENLDDIEYVLGWGDRSEWMEVEAIADGDYVAFIPCVEDFDEEDLKIFKDRLNLKLTLKP